MKVITEDRKPHYSGWYNRQTIITDVSIEQDGEKLFLRGFHAKHEPREKEEMKLLIKKLELMRRLKFYRFYGNEDTPLEFIIMMQQNNYHFGQNYRCEFRKSSNQKTWDFSGNLQEVSGAFHYRIFDRAYARKVYNIVKKMINIKTTFDLVDTEDDFSSLYHCVEALVKEQMINIEKQKPKKQRLEVWPPDWYEKVLAETKKMLPQLKLAKYETKITKVENVNEMWEGRIIVKDTINTWRGLISDHRAKYKTEKSLIEALEREANKYINYDKQHIRELLGFRNGKQAYCVVCNEPFSAFCSKKFHECETQRQGGYVMKIDLEV